MSNFTVNGVYSYTSANIYSYLGRAPVNSTSLERAFDDFNITPTGSTDDLKKLNSAMYEEYSKQVQEQIDNQNSQQNIPWASVCAQIGIQATGDYDKDYAAFNNAIQLLSQYLIKHTKRSSCTRFGRLRELMVQPPFGKSNILMV